MIDSSFETMKGFFFTEHEILSWDLATFMEQQTESEHTNCNFAKLLQKHFCQFFRDNLILFLFIPQSFIFTMTDA